MKKPRAQAPPALRAGRKIARMLSAEDPEAIADVIEKVIRPQEMIEALDQLRAQLHFCCQKLNSYGYPRIAGGTEDVAMAKAVVVLNKVRGAQPLPKI